MSKKKSKKTQRRRKLDKNLQSNISARTFAGATSATIAPDEFKKADQSYFEIPVIMKKQRNAVYFSGEMTIAQLAKLTYVDNYDSRKEEDDIGYQRNFIEGKGRAFSNFMSDQQNTCIGELMLNDRNNQAEFIPLKELVPEAPARKLSFVCGLLKIPADAKFYVYDGQTRRFGYMALLHFELEMGRRGENLDFQHLKVPFCVEQVTYMEELSRFLDHNGRHTRVPNAHRAMVVASVNETTNIIKNLTSGEKTYVLSAGVVRELNDSRTSPWHKLIKMPDTPLEEGKTLITTMASFHTGMKEMIRWMEKEYWSPETKIDEKRDDLTKISLAFWRAVKQSCPKIWRTPSNYVMHMAQGVSAMSMLMHLLYRDFFREDVEWNINNIAEHFKLSNILMTPKWWEKGRRISKRGGNFNQLRKLAEDMYMQIRKGI